MTDTPRQRRTFGAILSDIQDKLIEEQSCRGAALEELTRIDTRIRVLREIIVEAEKNGSDDD